MKKILLLCCVFAFFSLSMNAQGINQLWGLVHGSNSNPGVMFSTNSTGNNFQLRNQFLRENDGAGPLYTELVEYNGKFYGMTENGGINTKGVIFEWDPTTNIYTKKIDLSTANGSRPSGSLTFSAGKFYGMTYTGGINDAGVIFEWDPTTNIYSKKIDLSTANGSFPNGSLTFSAGKFYGMTNAGGINNAGVIFEWDPVLNVYTKKIDLSSAIGNRPDGNLTMNGGKFYGMTVFGGINNLGVIFEWDPGTNIYTKKIDLSVAIGYRPEGSLIFNGGKFYGMTNVGGINNAGVIFEWDPGTNGYTKKIDLSTAIGGLPKGNLTLNSGKFYGMTVLGGSNNQGVIFEWDQVTNVYTKKIDFSSANGMNPWGSLTLRAGKFYGMTKTGSFVCSGVIFEWDPVTNLYAKKIDLENVLKGIRPSGSLSLNGGKFYGMTRYAGNSNAGVIFEWDLATNSYTKKHDFNFTNGAFPYGGLTLSAGKFYGMTNQGGINNVGVIFEWDPISNVYTKKIDLSVANGFSPFGDLTLSNGKLYGMTLGGGSNNQGVIFEWDPVTNIYTKKIDLIGVNGIYPYGSLTFSAGKFYGMMDGGSNSQGVIFEWDPTTNIYTKKIDLSTAIGSFPYGSLTFSAGKFYGMTTKGGINNEGVIFEWDPGTNIYTKKIDLSAAIGYRPEGSLTLSFGKFYGLTTLGGTNDLGVFFEWDPTTNVYTKKIDFTGPNGALPSHGNGLTMVPAPVAKGNLVSCQVLPTINIDATNNNTWVPIVDNFGDIAAEINANGNNLGIVSTSLFTKNGTCREDWSNRLYLNRNITITPQTQPGSSVSVRLYVKKSELDSLRTALNSLGQPSGVASINEVDVFKNDDACYPVGVLTASPLVATTGTYNADYYLQVNISSFSSFYFANKLLTAILPVKIKSFTGKRAGAVNELKWEAGCNASVVFYIERSADGIHFETIGTVTAADCNQPFYFTDNDPFYKNNYYRLRIKETSGAINYSPIILLDADKTGPLQISVQPNLVRGSSLNAELTADNSEQIELIITDVTGRKILSRQVTVQVGINNIPLPVSILSPGIYWLYAVGKEGKTNVVRFVKQ